MAAHVKLSDLSQLIDQAEEHRREARLDKALEIVEATLQKSPHNPRALLLLGWILYASGKPYQAFKVLVFLKAVLGSDEGLKRIAEGLEKLWQSPDSPIDTTLATETMGDLHLRQGYYWEAAEIYRRLYLTSPGDDRLWQKILDLRDHLASEESRETPEHSPERLESLNLWIQNQQKGS
ncbi:MAG: tetratricopeptide repeat protein [Candidatus Binatia bacterium]|jgi:tetratricopeptide (TPR) repeat protein|nr:tetratricopeptide repeat protein [Candidatus Binatia bacterium]